MTDIFRDILGGHKVPKILKFKVIGLVKTGREIAI
jgi:hypothetical protein